MHTNGMDAKARIELIRGLVRGGSPRAAPPAPGTHRAKVLGASPRPARLKHEPPRGGVWRDSGYGVTLHPKEHEPAWVAIPDPKPVSPVRIKRVARVSPLTRIAEKWKCRRKPKL
jgi:hypothetical protein